MELTSGYHLDPDYREGFNSKCPVYSLKPLLDRNLGLNLPLLRATLLFSSDSSQVTVEGTSCLYLGSIEI
jgi:hypothetical protein